ncbi:serine/threonine protein kinase [Lacipirellula limnantheis]|uniref:Serine/threonine-protein kinase PknD n=1 Tax=Lacipirellula limnantheis TaxID=2528024 RepID=A0A517TYH2_9BACT|nr:serine/threonine-protein kinase [Lacipirellula limnantheis]QDT73419.1 Serine/threonine-protein kinase PknD [Lacipirellula limnantheis]
MNSASAKTAADASLVGSLLDRWEEAQEDGRNLTPEDLCRDCPTLLPELKRQIDVLGAMDRRLTQPVNENELLDGSRSLQLQSSFEQIRLHAKGGLGVVFSAEDSRLHRRVALKFIRQRLLDDPPSRQQFALEAEITGRLDHPGVVPVHGLGETVDGQSFYVMRFVQGESMDQALAQLHVDAEAPLDEHSSALRRLLGNLVSVCKTIAYAHNRGILHRDIKPANVMLGRYGETLVVDWGLAIPVGRDQRFKLEEEQTLMVSGSSRVHSSSSQVGTPAYMSPEQASGSESLQPASDIYSLGATLYKLLTGRVAFDAPTMPEMRQQIIRGTFPRPTQVRRGVPKALEAVCLKAMALDPTARYATALELGEDVERYLNDEPVSALPESPQARLARWTRRHRGVAQTGGALCVVLTLAGLGIASWMASVAQRESAARAEAVSARMRAEQSLRDVSAAEARSIARALESQMDQRLLVAEEAAADRELASALKAAIQQPANRELWKPVNAYLERQRAHWAKRAGFEAINWFVNLNDGQGTQIARAPELDPATGQPYHSLGQPFQTRQYFRGGSPDPPRDVDRIKPISGSFIAAPHRSTNNAIPKATFTAPIRHPDDPEAEILGVLGLAVEVYDLTNLDRYLAAEPDDRSRLDQMLTVVYAKPDYFDEQKLTSGGLVMQHVAFRPEAAGGAGLPFRPLYVDQRVRQALLETGDRTTIIEDYRDPLAAIDRRFAGSWSAAAVPIELPQFEGRDLSVADPGWFIVVQRRSSP